MQLDIKQEELYNQKKMIDEEIKMRSNEKQKLIKQRRVEEKNK